MFSSLSICSGSDFYFIFLAYDIMFYLFFYFLFKGKGVPNKEAKKKTLKMSSSSSRYDVDDLADELNDLELSNSSKIGLLNCARINGRIFEGEFERAFRGPLKGADIISCCELSNSSCQKIVDFLASLRIKNYRCEFGQVVSGNPNEYVAFIFHVKKWEFETASVFHTSRALSVTLTHIESEKSIRFYAIHNARKREARNPDDDRDKFFKDLRTRFRRNLGERYDDVVILGDSNRIPSELEIFFRNENLANYDDNKLTTSSFSYDNCIAGYSQFSDFKVSRRMDLFDHYPVTVKMSF